MKVTYTTLWEAEKNICIPLIQTTPIHSLIVGRPRPSCHCFVATNTGRPSDQSQPATLETAGGEGGAPGDEHTGARRTDAHFTHGESLRQSNPQTSCVSRKGLQRRARLINATALPYLLLCYGVTQINWRATPCWWQHGATGEMYLSSRCNFNCKLRSDETSVVGITP